MKAPITFSLALFFITSLLFYSAPIDAAAEANTPLSTKIDNALKQVAGYQDLSPVKVLLLKRELEKEVGVLEVRVPQQEQQVRKMEEELTSQRRLSFLLGEVQVELEAAAPLSAQEKLQSLKSELEEVAPAHAAADADTPFSVKIRSLLRREFHDLSKVKVDVCKKMLEREAEKLEKRLQRIKQQDKEMCGELAKLRLLSGEIKEAELVAVAPLSLEETVQLNNEWKRAVGQTSINIAEIERLIDIGLNPNAIKWGNGWDAYPLHDELQSSNPESVAVVELLVKKGADLEFKCYGRSVLGNLLCGKGACKAEKLSILLHNGIELDPDVLIEGLDKRLGFFRHPEQVRKHLEHLVIEELEKRVLRQRLLSNLVQFFLPAVLADVVAEYRGHLGIKTAQDLHEEEKEQAEQQALAQEQKQQEQLQQKSKLAGEIIWV
jgi:hypothetical protein